MSKRGASWILRYVKSAKAETDIPTKLHQLIQQRRRWMNGSFFSALHSIVKFYYIYRSSHSVVRKLWIQIEFLYLCFNLVFSFMALVSGFLRIALNNLVDYSQGNFFVVLSILGDAMVDPSLHVFGEIKYINLILNYGYLVLLLICFILALGNRPQDSTVHYTIAMIGFAVVALYMLVCCYFHEIASHHFSKCCACHRFQQFSLW